MRATLLLVVLVAACRTAPVGPYTPPTTVVRGSVEAERLTRLAGDLVEGNPSEAEKLLRQALTADLYHGPAHNNLGVLFLNKGELYEASVEFEWARKLMPGNPDPRVNLALTLERAGRIGEAIDAFRAALEVAPEDIAATQGIAMATVRSGQEDAALQRWFDRIALAGETEGWREWARDQRGRVRAR